MRDNKKLFMLLAIFLAFVSLLLIKDFLGQTDKNLDYRQAWEDFNPEQVSSFTISANTATISATKNAEVWLIENKYAADSNKITDIINSLIKPTSNELVSQISESHSSLGLKKPHAATMTFNNGERSLLLGNKQRNSVYVRLDNDNRSFIIKGVPVEILSADINDWIDKTILRINEDDIKSISVSMNGVQQTITNKEGQWHKEDEVKALNREPLSALINTLDSFIVQELASTKHRGDYPTNPTIEVVVVSNSDNNYSIKMYEGSEDALVEVEGVPGTYIISQSLLGNFIVTPDDFIYQTIEVIDQQQSAN